MGLFDTIEIIRVASALLPQCAAGHPITEFQTKDFEDPYQRRHLVFDDVIYRLAERQPLEERSPTLVDTTLIVVTTHEVRYERLRASGNVCAYSYCHECDPVVFEAPLDRWHGGIDHVYPWCEYDILFRDGQLTEVHPITLESRDDVEKKFPNRARVPDTDRIAVRHFELLRKNPNKR